jgi:hypothetical protein
LTPRAWANSLEVSTWRSTGTMAVSFQVHRGGRGDEALGGIVGDEAGDDPPGDVAGGGRVPGQEQQHAVAEVLALLGRPDPLAPEQADGLGAVPVAEEHEVELVGVGVAADAPPAHDQGRTPHVGLGVDRAAVGLDAQGVQLEQLPSVVLVDAVGPAGVAALVVEVVQHRAGVRAGRQQVGEAAHGVGSDHPLVALAAAACRVARHRPSDPTTRALRPRCIHPPARRRTGAANAPDRRTNGPGARGLPRGRNGYRPLPARAVPARATTGGRPEATRRSARIVNLGR